MKVQKRIGSLIFGKRMLKDLDEAELRGCRDALNLIHREGAKVAVTDERICDSHRMCRGKIWNAGKYQQRDGEIIEKCGSSD